MKQAMNSLSLSNFLERLRKNPGELSFADTMEVIENNYSFEPAKFLNGAQTNLAGQNSGSCKIFSFARVLNLTKEDTLFCFGEYYRKDVLGIPDGEDHANIRQFMRTGWEGISFEREALAPRK
jgi:hypothetical protein